MTPERKWKRLWTTVDQGGPIQFGPLKFGANTYEDMEVHFNVGDGSNPADWSVVAWGESGPVYVHNTGADASDHWPTDPKHRTPSGGKPETWDATKP